MRALILVFALLAGVVSSGFADDDRRWENPVFDSAEEAVAAAEKEVPAFGADSPAGLRLFIAGVLGASGDTGKTVDRFLVTHPASALHNPEQQRTVDRFEGAIPRQSRLVEKRLARFGFPELEGLVYCRLVDSVDAFSGLNTASSDRMSRVGGVTYYCRYVVLPLSYIGAENLRELRTSVALNPGLDYASTVSQWQKQSYASLVSTFRHELVHVFVNSTLDVPAYSDRARFPTWFHEGSATYLSGDPHSGLSTRYREYQNMFFFLVQRHGVGKLENFYTTVFGGSDVAGALNTVYSITGYDDLSDRSSRWHGIKSKVSSALWIVALGLVALAFAGKDLPVIASLQLLFAIGMVFALLGGIPQHLFGLNGPTAVLVSQLFFGGVALAAGTRAVLRIRRRRTAS